MRAEIVPGAALFRTAGPGIAWPGSGAQGHPSRSDVPYPVTTVAEAREAVADYALMKPEFIKIWTDDRDGHAKKLTPPIYRAIAEESHARNIPVVAHNVTLADAKELMRAGVEGWVHTPVRGGDEVDDEILAIVKDRIAKNDRPNMWMTPGLRPTWMNTQGGTRPVWLDDPLLQDTSQSRARRPQHDAAESGGRPRSPRHRHGTDPSPHRLFRAPGTGGARRHRHDAGRSDCIANTRRINRVYLRGQEVDRAGLRARWQAQMKGQRRPATF
jgi:hypothetical protein